MVRAAAVIVYFADGVPQQNIRDGTGGHNPILRNPGLYPVPARIEGISEQIFNIPSGAKAPLIIHTLRRD
jgi:hypothetical protein